MLLHHDGAKNGGSHAMTKCSGTKFIDGTRTLAGYGDTKDLAVDDLLEKLKAHERDVKCTAYAQMKLKSVAPF